MSFSEMMESGRGPGVIGMLMALLVLAGFGALFVFAFDDKLQGGAQSIESHLASQAKEIAAANESISRAQKRLMHAPERHALKEELARIKRENLSRAARVDSLETGVASARRDVDSLMKEFEGYKEEYRAVARGKAKGETMERLETRDGNTYVNVTIKEVTPVGLQIMHDGGLKRIPYEELPAPLIDRFQFDPGQKAAAIAMEQAQRDRHEAAVSVAKTAAGEVLAEKRKIEADARREAMIRGIAVRQARLESLRDEIESLEEALPKESLKRLSRAPQMRAQLANKQRELAALQTEVARMQADVSR